MVPGSNPGQALLYRLLLEDQRAITSLKAMNGLGLQEKAIVLAAMQNSGQ